MPVSEAVAWEGVTVPSGGQRSNYAKPSKKQHWPHGQITKAFDKRAENL